MAPLFGDTYQRAQSANSKEEFFKSKEAATAAATWGSSLVGSAIQSYGVGALINATGTLSYKGAAYLGSLIFMASSAPAVSLSSSPFVQAVTYDSTRLSLNSSPKSVLSIPSPSAPLHVFSKLSASACSSHTGEPAPTHSTKRFAPELDRSWWMN
jgi:hypothetical protein